MARICSASPRELRSQPRDQIRAGQPDQHTRKQPDETGQGNSSRSRCDLIANWPMADLSRRRSGREKCGRRQRLKRSATDPSPWPARLCQSGRKYRMVDRERAQDLTLCSLDSPQCARTTHRQVALQHQAPRCKPLWRTPRSSSREPISNQAGDQAGPNGEGRWRRHLLEPSEKPTRVGSIPTPTGSSAPRSVLAKNSSHQRPS